MDEAQYSTLEAALASVPDARKRRGRRHRWSLVLTLIAAAMSTGVQGVKGIYDWIEAHEQELLEQLRPSRGLPSESTVRRALYQVDVAALEASLSAHVRQTSAAAEKKSESQSQWRGQAVDGKSVRGLLKHERRLHLVSLVAHASATVVGQIRVADKRNEIAVVPQLLAERDLTGTVTTMDALLTQGSLAQQIRDQNGQSVAYR